MRALVLGAAVSLLACRGAQVTAETRTAPADGSPSNPRSDATVYSATLATGEPARAAPVMAGPEWVASDATGYFWVNLEDGGFVTAPGNGRRFQAPPYAVVPATQTTVKPGDRVFVARVPPGQSGATASWHVATIERVDPMFDKAYAEGQAYDFKREVLLPKEPLLENTPIR